MTERKSRFSRRDALKTMAVVGVAASLPAWLQGCAVPEEAEKTGPLHPEEVPIDTVVCVMMENRSFDHYFGALSLEEGWAIDGLRSGLSNPDEAGEPIAPFLATRMCVEDPPHGYAAGKIQFNGGKMDGFVRAHIEEYGLDLAASVMAYHNRRQIPFLYAMADDFALCQKWYCSVMGPTWPNRWYLHAAQSAGETSNNPNGDYSFSLIYDRLAEKGLTYKYYYTDLPFLALSSGFGARHRGKMKPLQEFFADCKNGTLPNYCMVDPGFNLNDDHPPHHVGLGQQFMSSIYHALAQSPQWNRSILLITYDECGGFYDHDAPPEAKDDRPELFGRLGFRVPSIVAGPYVKKRFIDSTVYDHTSVLAFMEWLWGLKPLTQRDANANDLSAVLDVERVRARTPRTPPKYAPIVVPDSELTEACRYSGGLAPTTGPDFDMHAAANVGLIPRELDLRHRRLETLRMIAKIEASRRY